jgi:hypothetical protein
MNSRELKNIERHYLKWIEPHPTVSHHPLLSHQDIGISRKSTHNRCVRSCTGIRNADIYEHEGSTLTCHGAAYPTNLSRLDVGFRQRSGLAERVLEVS